MEIGNNEIILESKTLKGQDEINDGYSSIEELFSKISQITELQIEPNYPPQFRGEKFPTYIIVGDIHGEEYKLTRNMLQKLKQNLGGKHIIDIDGEGPEKEIYAVNVLNKKFGINIIGLENEGYTSEYLESLIGKGLSKNKGLKLVGLEYNEIKEKQIFSSLMPLIYLRRKIILKINDDKISSNIKPFQGDLGKLDDSKYDDRFDNLNQEELIKYLSIGLAVFKNLLSKEQFENIGNLEKSIISFFKDEGIDINSIDSFKNAEKIGEEYTNKYLEMRNKIGIKLIHQTLFSFENQGKIGSAIIPRVIVYGKDHIPGLINGINENYEGKVNIYIAK